MTLLKVSGSLVTTPLLFEIVWMIRRWKYAYETYMNQKYTSEKKYANEKCTNGKKGIKIIRSKTIWKKKNIKSVQMKSMRIESITEWKTTVKCLFNKTK